MPPCPCHTLPGHSCILFFGKCLFSLFPFVFVLLILILCEFWSRLPCHKLSWQHCLPCGGCYPSLTPPYHRVFLCCAEVHSLEASLSLCHVLICCLRASPELFFSLANVLKCFSHVFLLWRPLAGPWLWLLKTGEKWPPSSHRGFRGQVPLEPPLEGCIRRLWSWAWGGNTDTQLITAAHSAPS